MDENTQAKFAEKIKELLNMAKKKKNVLEYQEISDFFADMPLEEEQMEKVLEYLDQNNVDVLRITDDDDVDDEEIILTDDDEVDVENIDLSVPEGVSIEDPVRMYLKEIGKVPLLSDYGYSTAVGIFNSIINVILLLVVNGIVSKLNDGEGL